MGGTARAGCEGVPTRLLTRPQPRPREQAQAPPLAATPDALTTAFDRPEQQASRDADAQKVPVTPQSFPLDVAEDQVCRAACWPAALAGRRGAHPRPHKHRSEPATVD